MSTQQSSLFLALALVPCTQQVLKRCLLCDVSEPLGDQGSNHLFRVWMIAMEGASGRQVMLWYHDGGLFPMMPEEFLRKNGQNSRSGGRGNPTRHPAPFQEQIFIDWFQNNKLYPQERETYFSVVVDLSLVFSTHVMASGKRNQEISSLHRLEPETLKDSSLHLAVVTTRSWGFQTNSHFIMTRCPLI